MALPPKFKAFRLAFTGSSSASSAPEPEPEPLHTIELYLDFTCPFSAKLFNTVYTSLLPRLRASPLGKRVQLLFRPQIQPWHPSSTLTHEAALAVARLAAPHFWAFAAALFAEQKAYFDVAVVAETRNQTYRRLAALAAREVPGLDEGEVYALLEVPDKPGKDGALNVGNQVTDDLKLVVRLARGAGVHVSPTVFFDGVEAREISSSWTADQWVEWLGKKVV